MLIFHRKEISRQARYESYLVIYKVMRDYVFYVYILTNPTKTTLYIGMTNSLKRRLTEHLDKKGTSKSFTGKYFCHQLIYYEVFQYVNDAIARENQIKRWSRKKKELLINRSNPEWNLLNRDFISADYG